jgi:hypothetical protein
MLHQTGTRYRCQLVSSSFPFHSGCSKPHVCVGRMFDGSAASSTAMHAGSAGSYEAALAQHPDLSPNHLKELLGSCLRLTDSKVR